MFRRKGRKIKGKWENKLKRKKTKKKEERENDSKKYK